MNITGTVLADIEEMVDVSTAIPYSASDRLDVLLKLLLLPLLPLPILIGGDKEVEIEVEVISVDDRPSPRYEANFSVEIVADININRKVFRLLKADIRRARVKSLSNPRSEYIYTYTY